jgi:hypothetical protein
MIIDVRTIGGFVSRYALVVAVSSTSTVLISCDGARSTERYFADLPAPTQLKVAASFSAELEREYGVMDDTGGALSFGRIGAAALRADGRQLVVTDLTNCALVLIDLEPYAFRRVGRCGGGPGEYSRTFAGVSFQGDSVVLATDEGSRALSLIAPDGQAVRTWRPASLGAPGDLFGGVHPIGNGRAVLELNPGPGAKRGEGRYLSILGADSVTLGARALAPPPLADSALHRQTPYVTGPTTCVPPDGRPEVIVAANAWSDQVVVLHTPALTAAANREVSVDWRPLREREGEPGVMDTPAGRVFLACGDSLFIYSRILRAPQPRMTMEEAMAGVRRAPSPIVKARWDVFDYSGNLVATLEDSLPRLGPDSMLVATPVGIFGDRLYTMSNDRREHPVIQQYRVRWRVR